MRSGGLQRKVMERRGWAETPSRRGVSGRPAGGIGNKGTGGVTTNETAADPRQAAITRETTETQIAMRIALDGSGQYTVRTGIRFFDLMLELLARHGAFDPTVRATGDLDVEQHRTAEDVGIALGQAVTEALGSKRGINQAGYFVMPMDETLGVAAVDLSGRVYAVTDLNLAVERVGDMQAELVHDFFDGFAQGARANVHVKVLYGRSSHQQIEALFKAFAGRCESDLLARPAAREILPSTKKLL